MPVPLEVAVFSPEAAHVAQSLGASRIELNASGSYLAGGLTPPAAHVSSVLSAVDIPLRVMIRPRGPPQPVPSAATGDDEDPADFVYSDAEFAAARAAISELRAAVLRSTPEARFGFVFGVLARHPTRGLLGVDVVRCAQLVDAARPFPCVFHRAFDLLASSSSQMEEALGDLVRCGFSGVLTSGGADGPFDDHVDTLEEICRSAAGRIQVIIGGGVRAGNVSNPLGRLPTTAGQGNTPEAAFWMHSSCVVGGNGNEIEQIDPDELSALVSQLAKH